MRREIIDHASATPISEKQLDAAANALSPEALIEGAEGEAKEMFASVLTGRPQLAREFKEHLRAALPEGLYALRELEIEDGGKNWSFDSRDPKNIGELMQRVRLIGQNCWQSIKEINMAGNIHWEHGPSEAMRTQFTDDQEAVFSKAVRAYVLGSLQKSLADIVPPAQMKAVLDSQIEAHAKKEEVK